MFLVRARNSHGLSLPSQVAGPFHTAGTGGVRPTLPEYDIGLVSEKLKDKIVHMEAADVISSTAVKLNWKVHNGFRFDCFNEDQVMDLFW